MPTTLYYVDPNHTAGSPNGSASNPWTSYGSAERAIVDTELATNPVTVYFSARNYSTDTNVQGTFQLLLDRDDTSGNLLTVDGMSQYNTSAATPSWSAYSGSSQFEITHAYPISTGTSNTKRSNITVKGFKAIATQGQSVYWRAGDNVTIEDCECTASSPSHGPGLYFEYKDTSGISSSNITIQRNTVHNVYGEGIYFAGSRNSNQAAHDNINILNNTVYDVGNGGGEPDLLEVKDANTNVTISGNTCYNSSPTNGRDGIATDCAATIEKNFVYNCGRFGIGQYSFWNTYGSYRVGGIIRNNIVVDCGGSSSYSWDFGIFVGGNEGAINPGSGDTHTNTEVYNNTVFTTRGDGINVGSGCSGVVLRNNIISQSSGYEVDGGGTAIATWDSNLYYNSGGGNIVRHNSTNYTSGTISGLDANAVTTDPQFLDNVSPWIDIDFKINTASPAKDAGVTIAGATPDYFGNSRPSGASYDIGAHEYTSAAGVYFVDATNGNDSNDGLSTSTAWQTLAKVGSSSFSAGDSVLFKRGETWSAPDAITWPGFPSSGSAGNPITIGAYGTGAKPIIDKRIGEASWATPGNWTDNTGNVWWITQTENPRRLWLDGVEYRHGDNVGEVDATNRWWYDSGASRLYVYATAIPTTAYSTIVGTGLQGNSCIRIANQSHIIVENLDLRGADYCFLVESVSANCDNIIIRDCDVGENGYYGIYFAGYDAAYSINNCEIYNNTVDSKLALAYTNAQYGTPNGITVVHNVFSTLIHDNTVRDWPHNGIGISGNPSMPARDNLLYNNTITGPNVAYMRAFSFDGDGTTDNCTRNKFYNNLCHDLSIRSQVGGNANEVYYNIFYDITQDPMGIGGSDNAQALSLENVSGDYCINNKVYNNVIFNCDNEGIRIWENTDKDISGNEIINNICMNCGQQAGSTYEDMGIVLGGTGSTPQSNILKNNIVFKSGVTNIIHYHGTAMSVDTWNVSASNGDTVSGNIQSDPQFFDITVPGYDFMLLSGSPGIGAGLDVGLTSDYAGTAAPINSTFDIGAYEMASSNIYDSLVAMKSEHQDAYPTTRPYMTDTYVTTGNDLSNLYAFNAWHYVHGYISMALASQDTYWLDMAEELITRMLSRRDDRSEGLGEFDLGTNPYSTCPIYYLSPNLGFGTTGPFWHRNDSGNSRALALDNGMICNSIMRYVDAVRSWPWAASYVAGTATMLTDVKATILAFDPSWAYNYAGNIGSYFYEKPDGSGLYTGGVEHNHTWAMHAANLLVHKYDPDSERLNKANTSWTRFQGWLYLKENNGYDFPYSFTNPTQNLSGELHTADPIDYASTDIGHAAYNALGWLMLYNDSGGNLTLTDMQRLANAHAFNAYQGNGVINYSLHGQGTDANRSNNNALHGCYVWPLLNQFNSNMAVNCRAVMEKYYDDQNPVTAWGRIFHCWADILLAENDPGPPPLGGDRGQFSQRMRRKT